MTSPRVERRHIMSNNYVSVVVRHAQLEATCVLLWDLALKAEHRDNYRQRDKLLDARDLVVNEMMDIELSKDWADYLAEVRG